MNKYINKFVCYMFVNGIPAMSHFNTQPWYSSSIISEASISINVIWERNHSTLIWIRYNYHTPEGTLDDRVNLYFVLGLEGVSRIVSRI